MGVLILLYVFAVVNFEISADLVLIWHVLLNIFHSVNCSYTFIAVIIQTIV